VPPNILLVMTDQLVPLLTGPYGSRTAITPHLDALAARGVTFDNAYTPNPLCAPARAALVTGRYASDLGCWDNATVLHADEPTVAHYLTDAGYEAVLSGKMHFVGPDQLHGFRRRLTTDVFPAGMDWVPLLDEQGRFPRGGHARSYVPPQAGVRKWTKFLNYDEETNYRSLEYLRERSRTQPEEPFFLVASYHHPHDPFHVTQELWDLYEDVDIEVPTHPANLAESYTALDRWLNETHETEQVDLDDPDKLRVLRRAYLGLVTYVDRKLGELVKTLEDTGQLEDTLIVFTSDHGDMLGERRMVQKRCFYEWSARVPLIMRLPGDAGAGTRVTEPTTLLDLVPTFLDVAGVPQGERFALDGASLLPLAAGERDPGRFVLSEYHVEKVHAPSFMARRDRFKYVMVHGHEEQLFDLEADPGEWRNLIGQPNYREVEEELRGLVLARFDPAALMAAGQASIARRDLIRRANQKNGVKWDYQPFFDATKQYVR
jgi:choline-sulfatase